MKIILVLLSFFCIQSLYGIPYKDCSSGISISKGILEYWTKDKNYLVKEISNLSCDETQYYLIKLYKVNNALKKGQKENLQLLNPEEMNKSIFASPNKMIINPKRSEKVFLNMPSGRKNKELTFYKLYIIPVLPEAKYGFNNIEKEKNLQSKATVGMGAIIGIIVEPENPDYTYNIQQINQNKILSENKGNALIFINCYGKKDKKYKSQTLKLYPNDKKYIDLTDYSEKVNCKIQLGNKYENKMFTVN